MKRFILAIGIILFSCLSAFADGDEANYIPVCLNGKWGYIDKTGKYVIEPQYDEIRPFDESGLAAVKINDKWGTIDKMGKVVVEPQFEYPLHFKDGLAEVILDYREVGLVDITGKYVLKLQNDASAYSFEYKGFDENGLAEVKVNNKYGLMDKTGKFVLNPQYEELYYEKEDKTYKIFSYFLDSEENSEEKWGFFDYASGIVVEPQFDLKFNLSIPEISIFDENGLACVEVNGKFEFVEPCEGCPGSGRTVKVSGKWGIIDRTGKFVVEPKFETIWNFKDGLAVVGTERSQYGDIDKWGIIDMTGKFIIEPKFDGISGFDRNGLACVSIKEKRGLIDKTGKYILNPQYDAIYDKDEGTKLFYIIESDSKFGFFDYIANIIVEPQFEREREGILDLFGPSFDFDENGLAVVKKDGHQGVIDRTGKFVIEPKFDAIYTNSGYEEEVYKYHVFDENGFAEVKVDDKHGLIDKTGKYILMPQYDEIHYGNEYKTYWIELKGKWGLLDNTGKFISEPKFDERIYTCENGFWLVKLNGKWGYIDKTGNFVIEPQFDKAHSFYDGFAIVEAKGKMGIIDQTGMYLVEPNYDEIYYYGGYSFYSDYDKLEVIKLKLNDKWWTFDTVSKTIVAPQYEYDEDTVYFDENGRADVKVNGKWGIIDKAGKYIVNPQYDGIRGLGYETKMYVIKLNGKFGIIDYTGKVIFEPQFDERFYFVKGGLARVKVNGKYGVINTEGKFVVEPIYEIIEGYVYGDFEYYLVSSDGKVGVLDKNGKRITQLQFDKQTFETFGFSYFRQDRFYQDQDRLNGGEVNDF